MPVRWPDGWPEPGGLSLDMKVVAPGPYTPEREPAPAPGHGRDDFDAPALAPHWVGLRRPPASVSSLAARPGWLTLAGGAATLDSAEPTFIGRRPQHHHCRVRARVDAAPAVEAG